MTLGQPAEPGRPEPEAAAEQHTASPSGRHEAAVIGSRRTRLAAAAIAVLVLAADQVSKSLVLSADPRAAGRTGLLSVRLVRNAGASFGIGAGHPLLITVMAGVLLAVALVLLVRTRSRAVALSLAAVAGGAAGNLADRLLRAPGLGRGAVVDWIHLSFYPATFNIADIAIRLGALCAVVAVIGASRRGATQSPGWRRALADRFRRSSLCS
jgi:signal peptidase II